MMTSTLLDGACWLIFPLLPVHFYPDNEVSQAELKIKPKQKQNILLISQREEVEKRMLPAGLLWSNKSWNFVGWIFKRLEGENLSL